MKDNIIDIFSLFSRKISGYELELDNKLLDNFISILESSYDIKSLSSNFVWEYIAFQFAYWVDKRTRLDGRIPPNWIFGPKAFKRWKERNSENWLYFTNLFLNRYEIYRPIEFYRENMKEIFEVERKKFLNTPDGWINCQAFARYNESSVSCRVCKYKKICRIQEN